MAFSPETYALCLKNTAEKIDEALTSVYNYKGSVDTIADLPLTNNKVGDTYDVKSEGGQNYGWNGESWDSLGVNREATDTDLGLIKKKNNTFNTTTFVGDMTAINSDNTSITGSGITSVNGEGNFEVSKPTTILASKTNNIAGEVVNITPSSSMNVTAESINLNAGAGAKPLILSGDVTINNGFGYGTTHINSNIITKNLKGDAIDATSLTIARKANILEDLSAKSVYALNIGFKDARNFLYASGTAGVMILGENNDLCYPNRQSQVTKSIIIGDNNDIKNDAANIFVIGQTNYINGLNSIVAGTDNYTYDNYCLVSGTQNNAYALGQTIFGSHHNSTSASYDMRNAEYSLISGVSNIANGKTASVLGDNLLGSNNTGSLTIGTFNEKKDAMFVIGGGNQSSSGVITRKNVLEVYNDGTFFIGDKSHSYIDIPSSDTVNICLGNSSTVHHGNIELAAKNIRLHPSSSDGGNFYIGDQWGYYPNISSSSNTLNINTGTHYNQTLSIKSTSNTSITSTSASIALDARVINLNAPSGITIDGGYNGVNIGYENKINMTSGLKFTLGYELETSNSFGTEILLGLYNQVPTTGDLFLIGNGESDSSRNNALRLTGDGYLYYNTGINNGADYAEFYEWSDGNPNDEDRIGCFVTFDFNKEYNYKSSRQLPHIKIAQPGDYILGVISGNPALIGNGDEEWRERWLYDEFDRPIVKFVEVPIMELQEVETGEYRTEIQYDENDNEIEVQVPITKTKEVDTGKTEWKYVQVLNPDYDENKTYKSRIDRPEWEPIGMLGNLSIKDDGTCIPGEFCKCGVDGIATHADKRDFDTYLVTRRINDNVVKIVFK